VLQSQFFGNLGRTWGGGLLDDQQLGGGIGWGIGEFPTLLIAIVLMVQWARSDDRESRRYDRKADRDGDAELNAYNEMLARMSARKVSSVKSPAKSSVESSVEETKTPPAPSS
jgi:putative copper resistance protein D